MTDYHVTPSGIETGVLPAKTFNIPWPQLQVGQSYHVICPPQGQPGSKHKSVRSACYIMGKHYGRKFISRSTEQGIRIFRVE